MMFTSFDEKAFWLAIENKDYNTLKVNTVSTMLNDPTFERGETDKILQILQERVPEIFEDEIKLEFEERLERKDWTTRYFTKLTYWMEENFALSRMDNIKEVGRFVHKDTAKLYKEKSENAKADSVSPLPENISSSTPLSKSQQTITTAKEIENKATGSYQQHKSESDSVHPVFISREEKEKPVNFTKVGVAVAAAALVVMIVLAFKLLKK